MAIIPRQHDWRRKLCMLSPPRAKAESKWIKMNAWWNYLDSRVHEQSWVCIHFQEPRLELIIYQEVHSEKLEKSDPACPVSWVWAYSAQAGWQAVRSSNRDDLRRRFGQLQCLRNSLSLSQQHTHAWAQAITFFAALPWRSQKFPHTLPAAWVWDHCPTILVALCRERRDILQVAA